MRKSILTLVLIFGLSANAYADCNAFDVSARTEKEQMSLHAKVKAAVYAKTGVSPDVYYSVDGSQVCTDTEGVRLSTITQQDVDAQYAADAQNNQDKKAEMDTKEENMRNRLLLTEQEWEDLKLVMRRR